MHMPGAQGLESMHPGAPLILNTDIPCFTISNSIKEKQKKYSGHMDTNFEIWNIERNFFHQTISTITTFYFKLPLFWSKVGWAF